MKRIIIILLLVLGIHVTISSRAQAASIASINHGYSLTTRQKESLVNLNKLYYKLIKEWSNLHKVKTNLGFIKRTPQEYSHAKQELREKIKQTVKAIMSIYQGAGVSKQEITNKEQELLRYLTSWS